MSDTLYGWIAEMKADPRSSSLASGQRELLPLELTGVRPGTPQGQHIAFVGEVGPQSYYCKSDQNGQGVCATEWFYTSLASLLGIAVPDFVQIRNPENGELLFGSKESWGTADRFEVETLLTTPPNADPAIGDPYPWLSSYLSRLYAFDLLIGNGDRHLANYLLVRGQAGRQLLAFDFASAELESGAISHFAIAESRTLFVGRQLRKLRVFDGRSAAQLINQAHAIPLADIEAILTGIPAEWLSNERRGRVYEQWSTGNVADRLEALQRGLTDGSLL